MKKKTLEAGKRLITDSTFGFQVLSELTIQQVIPQVNHHHRVMYRYAYVAKYEIRGRECITQLT